MNSAHFDYWKMFQFVLVKSTQVRTKLFNRKTMSVFFPNIVQP